MLPCFHSVGHYFLTKSAHLYLQDMMALEQRMDPTEFKIFIEQILQSADPINFGPAYGQI
jgi:hypothetical protein